MEQILGLLAVHLGVAQVRQHQVDIGAAGKDIDASLGAVGSRETLSQNTGTCESALLTLPIAA